MKPKGTRTLEIGSMCEAARGTQSYKHYHK